MLLVPAYGVGHSHTQAGVRGSLGSPGELSCVAPDTFELLCGDRQLPNPALGWFNFNPQN